MKSQMLSAFVTLIFLICCTHISVGSVQQSQSYSNKCDASPVAIIFEHHYQGHPYGKVNLKRPKSDFNPTEFAIEPSQSREYTVQHDVGKGKFAKVYKATHVATGDTVAIKVLQKSQDVRTMKEIQLLLELQDAPNFIRIRDFIREQRQQGPPMFALVFNFFPAKPYKELFQELEPYQIKYFTYETLRSIDYVHSKGVMHKDIKPLNVLMDPQTMKVKVIDFGHSDYYLPGVEKSTRVASLHYKGPELLLNYSMYDYSLDIWSTGCMLAEMVFRKVHFFQSEVPYEQPGKGEKESTEAKMEQFRNHLAAVAEVLGSLKLRQYADKYKDYIDLTMMRNVGNHAKQPWTNFITDENRHLYDPLVADLLDKLLTYDHKRRMTAKEALQHPYFAEVRRNANEEI